MRRRSRATRVLKWVGVALCALIVAVWAVSVWWVLELQRDHYQTDFFMGAFWVRWDWRVSDPDQPTYVNALRARPGWLSGGYALETTSRKLGLRLPYAGSVTFNDGYGLRYIADFYLPLWVPFIALAIPTFILWRRDRRYPEGHCRKCGYDLTGNVSGVCPECGTAWRLEAKRLSIGD